MKTILSIAVSLLIVGQISATNLSKIPAGSEGGVASLIEAANKSGKAVFLVVFDKAGSDKDKALKIAKEASAKISNGVAVVEANTSDSENSGLVTKYRLAGAPLPLILVVDKFGTAAGGFVLAQATAEGLVNTIPSPKFSEILKGLSLQKSVLLVVYKESMVNKTLALAKCNEALKSMENNSIIVELNIDNKEEAILMKNLQVNALETEPVIYAINKAGQVTGTFPADTSAKQLVLAANKATSSGCGPGGCAPGSSCAPAKK